MPVEKVPFIPFRPASVGQSSPPVFNAASDSLSQFVAGEISPGEINVLGGPQYEDDLTTDEVDAQYLDPVGDSTTEVQEPSGDSIIQLPSQEAPSMASGTFQIPPGYVLVPEVTYHQMNRRLQALEDRVIQAQIGPPQQSSQEPGPVIRLRVLRECTLGDISQKLQTESFVEWVPNLWLKVGGRKFEKMDSFLIFFNSQNPAHPLYQPSKPPWFEVLNPPVFFQHFPRAKEVLLRHQQGGGAVAPVVTAQQMAVTRNQLPPVGTSERRQALLERPPGGPTPGRAGAAIPGMKLEGPMRPQDFPVNRGSDNHGRRTVAVITGKDAAFHTGSNNPAIDLMMQAARQGVK